ncbi:MAG: eukaryotic-like serine/threonine-protein kinase [Acidobacteriota bacterium]|jgi:serine/threonine protein kinase/Flp pilus assembly protein TadD|nr:eukaryotic-like serine/threonine-protein kinase [Acidobacteriota bacterium]
MTPERWQQIEEVFQTAVDLPPEERHPYLTLACGGDDTLRQQVTTLIEQYEAAGDFIEEPALAALPLHVQTDPYATMPLDLVADIDPAIGRRIGAYLVAREIGRGGMGAVYLAERADGEFRQRVAVKLIKRGMDTDFILRRFRNERQILATLDHQYIARLLDGGTTDDGLPYFVMEYIEGLPVYRFCDERKLTVGERLKLFRMVCDAVHYAHQKLVIHRDIKPSNILVADGGLPKLLDFGIAKLLNPEFSGEITLDPTATAMRLMTPEYAAPEQVRGEPVSPATDVYSLGVLLYELLTGHRPYRLRNRSPHEMARVICEEDPQHPSVRITSPEDLLPAHPSGTGPESDTLGYLYWCRGATVETLRRELAGDLDNIVMKALRKEPSERYQTAEEMREDITRFVEGRAVAAPPFFPAGSRRDASRTAGEPTREETSLAVLPLKIVESTGGLETGGEYLGVGLADALITRLGSLRRFTLRPTSSVLRYHGRDADPLAAGRELGVTYILEGRIRRAGQTLRVTLQLLDVREGSAVWAGQFDEDSADVLQLEDSISEQVAEALIPQLTGGERLRLQKRGTDRADAYEEYMRGRYHWNTFNEEGFARALVHYSRAVSLDPDYALAYAGIADYYNVLGVYAILPFSETSAAALQAARKSVALDPTLAEGYAALGFATLTHEFDWEESERQLRRASELNPNYVTGCLWLSFFLGMEGRFDEALNGARRALEIAPLTPLVRHTLNWTLYHARRFDEAIASARILVTTEPTYGLGHLLLSLALSQAGRHDEAVETCGKAVELLGRSPYSLAFLAALLAAAGRTEESRRLLEEIRRMEETRYVSPYMLALVYCRLSDSEGALEQLERAWEIRDARLAWLGVDPQFDSLRGHPRFDEVLLRTKNPAHAQRPTTSGGASSRDATPSGRQGPDSGATPPAPRDTEDEAQKLYKAGRYFVTRRTAEGLRQAIERFERAVQLAPRYGLAWAEMADSYSFLNWYVEPPPDGAWASAKQAALRAVEADDSLSEAHASLGFILFNYERDFAEAERELRRAIELNLENAVARRWHAYNLTAMGRHDEAISEIRKAQQLAPRSPVIATALANILFLARRFEEAEEQCRSALELDPGSISTHIILRWSYEMRGMCDDALGVFEQERAFTGDTPTTRAKQAHVLASCGHPEEAREILSDLIARRSQEWVTAYEIAVIHSRLGERDGAFSWLARAEEEHSVGLTYLRVDPRLDGLRADPRFSELLRRFGK